MEDEQLPHLVAAARSPGEPIDHRSVGPLELLLDVVFVVVGHFPMETTYEFLRTDSSDARMVLRNRGEPAGFSRISAPMVARHAATRRISPPSPASSRPALPDRRAGFRLEPGTVWYPTDRSFQVRRNRSGR